MRKLRFLIVGIVVIVAIGLFLWFSNPLGRVVKAAIEGFGPEMTQAEVRVSKVTLSPTSGQGSLSGLYLGNPKGFKTDYAMKADNIVLEIDPASLAKDVVVIRRVLIEAPDIIYEKGDNGANFDAIQRNVEQYLGVSHKEKDEKEEGKKLIIESFVLRNAKVSYNDNLNLTLPDVVLHDIGKKSGGATPAQVTKAIVGEMVKQMALAIPKAVVGGVGAAVKGLFGK